MRGAHDNGIKISVRTFACCIFLMLSCVLLYVHASNASTLSALGANSIVLLIITLIVVLAFNKFKVMSFGFFFAVLAWVFHFGNFPLYCFEAEGLIIANDLRYYAFDTIVDGYNACLVFFCFLLLGMSIKGAFRLPASEGSFLFAWKSMPFLVIVFMVLFIPYIIDVLMNWSLGGYLAVRERGMSSIQAYVNELLYFLSIIIFYKAQKNRCFVLCVFIAVCFVPTLFVGERGTAVCLLVIMLLMIFREKRMRLRYLVLFFSGAVIGIYLLNTIGRYRLDFANMLVKLLDKENFVDFLADNPLLHFLGEFGGTFTTPMVTVKNFPSNHSFLFGATYLLSCVMIIPGLSSFVPVEYLNFVYAIPMIDQHHLGGSFIGEAYANFGICGFVIMILLGNVVRCLSLQTDRDDNDLYTSWIYLLEFILLMVIRGYIKNIVFWAFWGYVLISILSKKKSKRPIGV